MTGEVEMEGMGRRRIAVRPAGREPPCDGATGTCDCLPTAGSGCISLPPEAPAAAAARPAQR
ncbi:hypothetical protein STVA_01140 [Allostella vacuolata]|nr:hypothetical protein STVA_01140 [Stella vacuolata]